MQRLTSPDSAAIDGLLHFGFDPTLDHRGLSLVSVPRPESTAYLGWNAALEHGQVLLDRLIEAAYERTSDMDADTHVVPLSGGLDSRTLLAGLLDHADREDVKTITFGIAGADDFEYGRDVATVAGVEHRQVELGETDWSINALESTAAATGVFNQGFAQTAFDQAIYGDDSGSTAYWHGFLNDVLAGYRRPDANFDTWSEAIEWFCEDTASADEPFKDHDAAASLLPDDPWLPKGRLPFDQQLNIGVRQQCYVRPTTREDTLYPFVDDEWSSFLLSLPREWRENRRFYKELVQRWKPDLFDVPTSSEGGSRLSDPWWRKRLRTAAGWAVYDAKKIAGLDPTHDPGMYWNWDEAFRDRQKLRSQGEELLRSLAERDLPTSIDPMAVFDRHQDGENLSGTIRSLGSYELYLRV